MTVFPPTTSPFFTHWVRDWETVGAFFAGALDVDDPRDGEEEEEPPPRGGFLVSGVGGGVFGFAELIALDTVLDVAFLSEVALGLSPRGSGPLRFPAEAPLDTVPDFALLDFQ